MEFKSTRYVLPFATVSLFVAESVKLEPGVLRYVHVLLAVKGLKFTVAITSGVEALLLQPAAIINPTMEGNADVRNLKCMTMVYFKKLDL